MRHSSEVYIVSAVNGLAKSNGPYAGNLYVVMYNWTGTFLRVQVLRSTDGGSTWSQAVPARHSAECRQIP